MRLLVRGGDGSSTTGEECRGTRRDAAAGDIALTLLAEDRIRLSIIIPVGPGDQAWLHLVRQLQPMPRTGIELICSATEPPHEPPPADLRWLTGPVGRAGQQNRAAAVARGRWLWFLHADSTLPPDAISRLEHALAAEPAALHYFDLRFTDGPPLMRLNQWGVQFRSRLLGLPFGDQGLALERAAFLELGGFPEGAPYGEDHLLVWAARRRGMPLRPVEQSIGTSARAYVAHGWARTTARHLRLTVRQALPVAWQWLRGR